MLVTGTIFTTWLSWANYVSPKAFSDTITVCIFLTANIPLEQSFCIICPTVEMNYLLWHCSSKPIAYWLWMPHPWRCSGSGLMGLWGAWSSERCPCQWRGEGIRWYLRGPFQPKPLYDSMILWYVCKTTISEDSWVYCLTWLVHIAA